jgi:hypothetical protein
MAVRGNPELCRLPAKQLARALEETRALRFLQPHMRLTTTKSQQVVDGIRGESKDARNLGRLIPVENRRIRTLRAFDDRLSRTACLPLHAR